MIYKMDHCGFQKTGISALKSQSHRINNEWKRLKTEQMESLEGKSIGQIVTEDYRAARSLQEYKLDFCCDAERSIDAACQSVGADITEGIGAIKSATENAYREDDDDD